MVRETTPPTGSVCVSIDVELAWGSWDRPSAAMQQKCAQLERVIVQELLRCFERHDVPATWAIVGRLLDRDERRDGNIWYAPDVVDQIRKSRVSHEIGSHGYAHIYFGESDREALRADLAAARQVHARHGLPFESFVFPRNQVAHLDLLHESGIRVFRSVDRGWHTRVRKRYPGLVGRAANFADKSLPIPPAVVEPESHDGLVELPSSMLLFGRAGVRRAIPAGSLTAKALLGIERARRSGGIFHLWFHPSNFYYDMERQLQVLDTIVSRAARLRDRNLLAIRCMNGFAS